MSWNSFHNRGEILRAVVDLANRRCDGVLPTEVPGVAERFTDDLDLVGALQLKWNARLSGNIERAWAAEPMDLESAVVSAWRETAEQMRGVRLVLDRCAEQPSSPDMERVTARATQLERARLATAAGLASGHSPAAVAVGRRLEERARELVSSHQQPVDQTTVDPQAPAAEAAGESRRTVSFADRIRAALAA